MLAYDHETTRNGRDQQLAAGATGAECLDVLAPYELLAASGRFNVYTRALERVYPGGPASQPGRRWSTELLLQPLALSLLGLLAATIGRSRRRQEVTA
jgi:hypothetical protein